MNITDYRDDDTCKEYPCHDPVFKCPFNGISHSLHQESYQDGNYRTKDTEDNCMDYVGDGYLIDRRKGH